MSDELELRVAFIQQLERETGIEINNTKDYEKALAKWKQKDAAGTMGKTLRAARKDKGWSVGTMACHLAVSSSYLCDMEKGRKPLTPKALEFAETFRLRASQAQIEANEFPPGHPTGEGNLA